MPIKLCQNCGLKVFVEEGQPIPVPFLCARCNAAMRASQQSPERAPTMVMTNRPRAVSAETVEGTTPPPPSAPPSAGTKTQLSCPGCGATFSVKLPEQPSRGKCPKCFQSLLVYPDGIVVVAKSSSSGVRPAVTDAVGGASASRAGQPAAASPSASRVGRPVAAASPSASRVGQPAAAPTATRLGQGSAQTATRVGRPAGTGPAAPRPVAGSSVPTPMPGVRRPAAPTSPEEPVPEAAPSSEPVSMEGPPAEGAESVPVEGAPAAEAAAAAPEPAEAAPAAEPSPEAAPAAEEPAKPDLAGAKGRGFPRRPLSSRTPESSLVAGDGTGKIAFTIGAVALPVLLGLILYFMRGESSVSDLLEKAGKPFKKGLSQMMGEMGPVTPPPAKAPAKAPEAGAPQAPKAETPKGETPKPEAPKSEAPAAPEAPKPEAPKSEAPAAPEVPKPETPAAPAPKAPESGTPPAAPAPEGTK